MEIIKEDFYTFLKSIVGVEITDNTFFFHELGMDGLDAWSFIEAIAKKYHVDFSGYKWQEYHDSEADITNLLKGIMSVFKKKAPIKKFSALHLYNVVQTGRWLEPTEQ